MKIILESVLQLLQMCFAELRVQYFYLPGYFHWGLQGFLSLLFIFLFAFFFL